MNEQDALGQSDALMFGVGIIGLPIAALIVALTASVWVGFLILAVGIILLLVAALMRPTMYRLVQFLFLLGDGPIDRPTGGSSLVGWPTVLHTGADPSDPNAPRVLIEDVSGKVHVSDVLPPGGDLKAAWRQTINGLQVTAREVRAVKGDVIVHLWRPSVRNRISTAFAVAFRR